MGRKPKQVVKGKHSSAFYIQLTKPVDGKKQVKLRLKVDHQTSVIDLPLIVDKEKIKVLSSQFQAGRVTGGFENPTLRRINEVMLVYQYRAVELADDFFVKKQPLTGTLLSSLLINNKTLKVEAVPDEVQKVLNSRDPKYKEFDDLFFTKEEQVQQAVKKVEEEKLILNPTGLTPNERYKKGHWNKNNIFELLGFVRYATKTDALQQEVGYVATTFHKLYKKLIYYRINVKPVENVSQFNEEWVHGFYRFIFNNGFERRLQKVEANPFFKDDTYLVAPNAKLEKYNINTFGESIHKGMVKYIKVLHQNKLIPSNFSDLIEAKTFAKNYDGKMSDYGDAIYFITPKEFLAVLKTNVESQLLNQTRHLFICQVMIGALRLSDLNKEKVIDQVDHFQLIKFKQAKVKSLVSNVILKPVQDILKMYKGVLPLQNDKDYNDNLKLLFKHLTKSGVVNERIIKKTEKKLEGPKVVDYKLHQIISSKFARSTRYVIGGAMGESLEEIAKLAGHSSTDIVMKHYYNVSKGYTENDIAELLEYFQ